MKLVELVESFKTVKKQSVFSMEVNQYGKDGSIFNADVNGEQKVTVVGIGTDDEREVPMISKECFTNGIFQHRGKNIPSSAYNAKKGDIKGLRAVFEVFKHNRVQYRGGVVAAKNPAHADKVLKACEVVPFEKNQDYRVIVNRRLGIMADNGKNDFPRAEFLYKNLKMYSRVFLDFSEFTPNTTMIKDFCEKVDSLKGEEDFKQEVADWIKSSWKMQDDGTADREALEQEVDNLLWEYKHQVHKKYNSFFLVDSVEMERVDDNKSLKSYLNKTSHHY